jgi:hypothetical protein
MRIHWNSGCPIFRKPWQTGLLGRKVWAAQERSVPSWPSTWQGQTVDFTEDNQLCKHQVTKNTMSIHFSWLYIKWSPFLMVNMYIRIYIYYIIYYNIYIHHHFVLLVHSTYPPALQDAWSSGCTWSLKKRVKTIRQAGRWCFGLFFFASF